MDKVIILDADMASAFAKIKRLELLEAISICRHRGYVFSSIDATALRFAEENGVETLELHSILRSLWESGMQLKDEVEEIVKEIEMKDNTKIKDVEAIFR